MTDNPSSWGNYVTADTRRKTPLSRHRAGGHQSTCDEVRSKVRDRRGETHGIVAERA